MKPLHWIFGREWEYSRHHSVKHHTVGVEIASRISGPIHATSLFRSQERQNRADWIWSFGPFSRRTQRDIWADQTNFSRTEIYENIARVEVPVNETPGMQTTKC
jgi:hypothetical protein